MNLPTILATAAVALASLLPTHAEPLPFKVFILAGQSNMEGHAKVSLMDYQVAQPATRDLFARFQKDGKWTERADVSISFHERHGKLTVGYGAPGCIGPELQFGCTVGDHYLPKKQPVLLIKPAWGGRSLWQDFRSPSAGLPAESVLQKMLADRQKKKPEATPEDIQKTFGVTYREMLGEIKGALENLTHDGQTYELGGFVWFQGWNDMISSTATAEYTSNLTHFIRDVRADLKSPKLPFVVAQMGVEGIKASKNIQTFKDAEAAILEVPEFKGNVALVKTDAFWDTEADAVFRKGWEKNLEEWNKVGSNFPYHYLGSARTLCAIGQACAASVLELSGERKSTP